MSILPGEYIIKTLLTVNNILMVPLYPNFGFPGSQITLNLSEAMATRQ